MTATRRATATRLAATVFLAAAISAARSFGQSPAPPRLIQYQHTAWGLKDGAPLWVNFIAQSPDGFLWLAAHEGLYRFDGIRFEFYRPSSGPALAAKPATGLFVDPGGDVWVGYSDGEIARISHNVTTSYPNPFGYVKASVFRFASDHDGMLWASTADGLLRFQGNAWQKANEKLGLSDQGVRGLYVDPAGTLWFATRNAVYSLPRGATRAVPLAGVTLKSGYTITHDPNGHLWIADVGDSVHPLPNAAAPPAAAPAPLDRASVAIGALDILFNEDGSLWMPTVGDGLFRIPNPRSLYAKVLKTDPAVEAFTSSDGLSSNAAFCVFRDREGDIWVGTFNGVDRFRPSDIVPVKLPQTLSSLFVSVDANGDPWIASTGLTFRLPVSTGVLVPFPNHYALSFNQMLHDPNGDMWWANDDAVVRVVGNQQTRLPPPIVPTSEFYIFEDSTGSLYAFVNHRGLFHWLNGQWIRPPGAQQEYPSAISAYEVQPGGHAWLGFTDGSLRQFFDGQLQTVISSNDRNVGPVRAIDAHPDHAWLAGDKGLAFYRPNHPLQIIPRTFPKGNLSLVETHDGDLWIVDRSRVTRIKADSLRLLRDDPASQSATENIIASNVFPSVVQGSILDNRGRLWIFSADGLAWIDTSHVTTNALKPPVVITAINADGRPYSADRAVLPAQTRSLNIHFAALSFPVPEGVQIRYRLDGVDSGWQDSNSLREAFYTNLAPGNYHFHVMASNNDGIWNNEGATTDFRIAPAWFQTTWFTASWCALVCLLIWTLYRIRVGYLARAISARFDERLAERTRMARELHDTFLQTIQGSKMVADDALDPTSDQARMRHALERLSLWLGQAVTEGRAALHALRVSTTERNHLAEFLDHTAREHCQRMSISVALTVIGDARDLHPIVRDEVSRIAEEAIRNTCLHSKASQLNIELRYADNLYLSLKDNGVGIDPEVLEAGKEGHFGLQGMKERSARIRARITLTSNRKAGTEITISVPGDVVYDRAKRSVLNRIRTLWGRGNAKAVFGSLEDRHDHDL